MPLLKWFYLSVDYCVSLMKMYSIFLIFLLFLSCSNKTPKESFELAINAIINKEHAKLQPYLSKSTLDKLNAHFENNKIKPLQYLLENDYIKLNYEIVKLSELSKKDGIAILEIKDELQQTQFVRMKLEEGVWKMDLIPN